MDPKKISGLDPKLRETYERVMGTSNPANQAPQAPVPNQPPPVEPLAPPPSQPISGFIQKSPYEALPEKPKEELPPLMETQTVENSPLMQNLNMNTPQEDFTKSPFLNSGGAFANPNPTPQEVAGKNQDVSKPQKEKGKRKLLPVFIFLGIVVFFIIYAVVWAKLFNLF